MYLQPIYGTELNQYVINLLKTYEIKSVHQFLREQTNKLTKFTNLSESEIDLLKTKLIETHSPTLQNAFDIYNKLHKTFPVYSTGIESFDMLLDGGFLEGSLIELVGLPGSGKSLLCSTLAINIANKFEFDVIYLDTKNDFSGKRIYKILRSLNFTNERIGEIMKKIKVERAYEPKAIIDVLKYFEDNLKTSSSKKILIIDSIPAIAFQFHNEKKNWLNEIGIILRRLANEYRILVLVINILTKWNEDLNDVDSIKPQTTVKTALGKYWETVPAIRLQLEEITEVMTSSAVDIIAMKNKRQLKITKSCFHKTGQSCLITFTECGGVL